MTVSDILKEDSSRMARLLATYDPLAGSTPGEIDIGRCQEDFEYWAATCCHIKNKKGGEDILFRLNYPQRKMVKILEEMRRAGKPIRLILLKARQWGGSTCAQLYMAWLQLMKKSGLNSLIVAHQHSATSEIRDMFLRMINSYPEKLLGSRDAGIPDTGMNVGTSLHDVSRRKSGKSAARKKRTENAGPGTIRVLSGNFKVKVGSAERPDSCRGGDYSLVHCSEVALWKKSRLKTPEDMMRAATSGVLLEPLTMILLESTANGTGNFFYYEYKAAKEGESQFRHLFIPWFEIEQYSRPLHPEAKKKFARMLLDGKDSEHCDSNRRQPGKYLWWLWEKGATLEAINWYISERAKYSDHGQMAAEYPSDDVEAFVHSGARVFDKYRVEKLGEGCTEPLKRGEITGEKPSGPLSLQNLKFNQDSQGALSVWKFPEKRKEKLLHRYLAVVDIGGRSLKADWSVVCVFDREPMVRGEPPEVVAQWRGHTDFDLLAWNAARIARFYDDALLVVESNTLETHDRERNVEGDQSHYLLHQLKQAYRNLYTRRRSPEDIRQGAPLKYGFHTNIVTKPLIIANLVKIVREGMYVERDKNCLEEFMEYEQRPDGSYGAISGKHDDILMTRAIGLHICFNEMKLPSEAWDYEELYSRQRRGSYASF